MTNLECNDLICDICFEPYEENSVRSPIRLYCCGHHICRQCIDGMIQNLAACPWCKRKWVARLVLKKCEENTPCNFYQILKNKVDRVQYVHGRTDHAFALGDGALSEDYEKQREALRKRDRSQLEADEQLAKELEQQLEAEERRRREDIEMKDAELAKQLSEQLSKETKSSSSALGPRSKSARVKEMQENSLSRWVCGGKPVPKTWSCVTCTLSNPVDKWFCAACGNSRSKTLFNKYHVPVDR